MEQGRMTSPTLDRLLKTRIAAICPTLDIRNKDKVALLESVMAAQGWLAIVDLGRSIRYLTDHPVVRALVSLRKPEVVIERWMRLERFGHSRNYTRLVDKRAASDDQVREHVQLTLRHVARDGGRIVPVNDLFVWGLQLGLLEAARVPIREARLGPVDLMELIDTNNNSSTALPCPTPSHTLIFCARATVGPKQIHERMQAHRATASVSETLSALVATDLPRAWTLELAAKRPPLANVRYSAPSRWKDTISAMSFTVPVSRLHGH